MITPAMLRQAAEGRPPTAADAERRRARADSNLRADAPEFLPKAAPVVPPEPELVCEQCLNPMREVGELIKCNHLCEKMLCADCYPPPCHDPCCGARPVQAPPTTRPAPHQVRVRGGFGARPLLALVLFAMCAVGESAPRDVHDDIPLAVGVVRSTLFDGLPPEFAAPLDQVLDNRLAPSSMRKVRRAAKVWCVFAAEQGWPALLRSDDPHRGAKLAAFVLMLVMTTKLVYTSISKYMWGLATWCILQRQADPRIGVEGFKSFMNSIKVLTFVPAQPHDAIPIEILERILVNLDKTKFADAQLGFLISYMLFTFNRSETPLPKAKTGPEAFDPETCFNAEDFRVERNATTKWKHLCKARQRKTKTDARMERPEARGAGDWAHIGDVPDEFAIFRLAEWFRLGRERPRFESGAAEGAIARLRAPVGYVRRRLFLVVALVAFIGARAGGGCAPMRGST